MSGAFSPTRTSNVEILTRVTDERERVQITEAVTTIPNININCGSMKGMVCYGVFAVQHNDALSQYS